MKRTAGPADQQTRLAVGYKSNKTSSNVAAAAAAAVDNAVAPSAAAPSAGCHC